MLPTRSVIVRGQRARAFNCFGQTPWYVVCSQQLILAVPCSAAQSRCERMGQFLLFAALALDCDLAAVAGSKSKKGEQAPRPRCIAPEPRQSTQHDTLLRPSDPFHVGCKRMHAILQGNVVLHFGCAKRGPRSRALGRLCRATARRSLRPSAAPNLSCNCEDTATRTSHVFGSRCNRPACLHPSRDSGRACGRLSQSRAQRLTSQLPMPVALW